MESLSHSEDSSAMLCVTLQRVHLNKKSPCDSYVTCHPVEISATQVRL